MNNRHHVSHDFKENIVKCGQCFIPFDFPFTEKKMDHICYYMTKVEPHDDDFLGLECEILPLRI